MAGVRAMIAVAALLAGAGGPVEPIDKVKIEFICAEQASARRVAVEKLFQRPDTMPADCRMVAGMGMPEQAAIVLEIVDGFGLDDGRFITVGRVLRNGFEHGYSAGEAILLTS